MFETYHPFLSHNSLRRISPEVCRSVLFDYEMRLIFGTPPASGPKRQVENKENLINLERVTDMEIFLKQVKELMKDWIGVDKNKQLFWQEGVREFQSFRPGSAKLRHFIAILVERNTGLRNQQDLLNLPQNFWQLPEITTSEWWQELEKEILYNVREAKKAITNANKLLAANIQVGREKTAKHQDELALIYKAELETATKQRKAKTENNTAPSEAEKNLEKKIALLEKIKKLKVEKNKFPVEAWTKLNENPTIKGDVQLKLMLYAFAVLHSDGVLVHRTPTTKPTTNELLQDQRQLLSVLNNLQPDGTARSLNLNPLISVLETREKKLKNEIILENNPKQKRLAELIEGRQKQQSELQKTHKKPFAQYELFVRQNICTRASEIYKTYYRVENAKNFLHKFFYIVAKGEKSELRLKGKSELLQTLRSEITQDKIDKNLGYKERIAQYLTTNKFDPNFINLFQDYLLNVLQADKELEIQDATTDISAFNSHYQKFRPEQNLGTVQQDKLKFGLLRYLRIEKTLHKIPEYKNFHPRLQKWCISVAFDKGTDYVALLIANGDLSNVAFKLTKTTGLPSSVDYKIVNDRFGKDYRTGQSVGQKVAAVDQNNLAAEDAEKGIDFQLKKAGIDVTTPEFIKAYFTNVELGKDHFRGVEEWKTNNLQLAKTELSQLFEESGLSNPKITRFLEHLDSKYETDPAKSKFYRQSVLILEKIKISLNIRNRMKIARTMLKENIEKNRDKLGNLFEKPLNRLTDDLKQGKLLPWGLTIFLGYRFLLGKGPIAKILRSGGILLAVYHFGKKYMPEVFQYFSPSMFANEGSAGQAMKDKEKMSQYKSEILLDDLSELPLEKLLLLYEKNKTHQRTSFDKRDLTSTFGRRAFRDTVVKYKAYNWDEIGQAAFTILEAKFARIGARESKKNLSREDQISAGYTYVRGKYIENVERRSAGYTFGDFMIFETSVKEIMDNMGISRGFFEKFYKLGEEGLKKGWDNLKRVYASLAPRFKIATEETIEWAKYVGLPWSVESMRDISHYSKWLARRGWAKGSKLGKAAWREVAEISVKGYDSASQHGERIYRYMQAYWEELKQASDGMAMTRNEFERDVHNPDYLEEIKFDYYRLAIKEINYPGAIAGGKQDQDRAKAGSEYAAAQRELKELTKEKEQNDDALDKKKGEITTLKENLKDFDLNNALEEEKKKAEKKLKELNAELVKLKNDKTSLESKIKNATNVIENLQNQIDAKKQLLTKEKETRKELEKEEKKLRDKQATDKKDLETKKNAIKKNIQSLEEQNLEIIKETNSLQALRTKYKKNQDLYNSGEVEKTAIPKLREKLGKLTADIKKQELVLGEKTKKRNSLATALKAPLAIINNLQTNINKKAVDIQTIQDKIEKSLKTTQPQISKELAGLKTKKLATESVKEKDTSTIEQQIKDKNNEITDLNKKLPLFNKLQTALKEEKKLETKKKELEPKIKKAEKEKKAKKEALAIINVLLPDPKTGFIAYLQSQENLTLSERLYHSAKEKIRQAQEIDNKNKPQLAELTAKIKNKKDELIAIETKISKAKPADKPTLTEQKNLIKKQIENWERQIIKINERPQRLKAYYKIEIAKIQKEIKTKNALLKKLKEKKRDLKSLQEINNLQKDLQKLKLQQTAITAVLSRDITPLKTKFEDFKTQYEKLKNTPKTFAYSDDTQAVAVGTNRMAPDRTLSPSDAMKQAQTEAKNNLKKYLQTHSETIAYFDSNRPNVVMALFNHRKDDPEKQLAARNMPMKDIINKYVEDFANFIAVIPITNQRGEVSNNYIVYIRTPGVYSREFEDRLDGKYNRASEWKRARSNEYDPKEYKLATVLEKEEYAYRQKKKTNKLQKTLDQLGWTKSPKEYFKTHYELLYEEDSSVLANFVQQEINNRHKITNNTPKEKLLLTEADVHTLFYDKTEWKSLVKKSFENKWDRDQFKWKEGVNVKEICWTADHLEKMIPIFNRDIAPYTADPEFQKYTNRDKDGTYRLAYIQHLTNGKMGRSKFLALVAQPDQLRKKYFEYLKTAQNLETTINDFISNGEAKDINQMRKHPIWGEYNEYLIDFPEYKENPDPKANLRVEDWLNFWKNREKIVGKPTKDENAVSYFVRVTKTFFSSKKHIELLKAKKEKPTDYKWIGLLKENKVDKALSQRLQKLIGLQNDMVCLKEKGMFPREIEQKKIEKNFETYYKKLWEQKSIYKNSYIDKNAAKIALEGKVEGKLKKVKEFGQKATMLELYKIQLHLNPAFLKGKQLQYSDVDTMKKRIEILGGKTPKIKFESITGWNTQKNKIREIITKRLEAVPYKRDNDKFEYYKEYLYAVALRATYDITATSYTDFVFTDKTNDTYMRTFDEWKGGMYWKE